MTIPAEIRSQLAQALEAVLPGRVTPYPPTTRRFVTPSIFIDQCAITVPDVEVVGIFPVWVLVDGASHAQMGMSDDLTWNAYLACWPLVDTIEARPQQFVGLRGTVIECSVALMPIVACGSEPPVEVLIPTPIPATA